MCLRFQGSYTAQAGVSTRSYYLSTLDVNQCQDPPQILLPHLSNHLHTVPPIHPFYSRQITTWYSEEAQKQINPGNGGRNGEVNVDLRLTVLKPRHASWLVDLYNHLSSDIGGRQIGKGWEKAGITQLLDESFSLSPEDPFEEIEGSIEIS